MSRVTHGMRRYLLDLECRETFADVKALVERAGELTGRTAWEIAYEVVLYGYAGDLFTPSPGAWRMKCPENRKTLANYMLRHRRVIRSMRDRDEPFSAIDHRQFNPGRPKKLALPSSPDPA